MQSGGELVFHDWGQIEYSQAWQMQEKWFNEKVDLKFNGGQPQNDFILCEHFPVYTLGRHGKENNMLMTDEQLEQIGAKLFKIDRGGDITFHGLGQIVGYPIIDLEQFGLGLKAYIWILEEIIIRTIAEWGIVGQRLQGATGVWVNLNEPTKNSPETLSLSIPRWTKICAIGVRASRYVTMHGFALNVNTDLRYFTYINPCGFTDKGVTSLEQLTGLEIDINKVKEVIKKYAKMML